MMQSIYSKTLYQKRFMLLGWFIGILFITVLTMSVFNSFSSGSLGDSLQSLPPALQKIVGDSTSFKSVGGYISQQIFALRMPVLLIILSIALIIGLTAGEEQQGLLQTQLSLPVNRSKLLLQKLAAAFTIVCLASLASMLGIAISLLIIGKSYNLVDVLPPLISCILVAFTYGLVGFTVASVTGRRGLALGIASGFAFLSYLINSMASSVSLFSTIDKVTLFHYYQTKGGYNWGDLLLVLIVALTLMFISVVAFERRDIG